ncbi:NUDIX hydrolase [Beutenbergia cavernae DSM 12333]|uniref:NUDIX hydrolase n=1 Tax=Beutenbergia cavernae (strain ATCC BAA-8 / DSM 12333 / CCUG 43141 / JCM 11478 / NBRC 16432 / NCIMB 13614 / HKI 0122) TaxID=471853 RepID=C5BVZ7_BEUC1|nr:NUDIX hydrolase [Beutenbergia cavernae]ACQ80598.1 NUDIX hydrolase [Beutenbergia cavernae DSM 12333]
MSSWSDERVPPEVLASETVFAGRVFDVDAAEVDLGVGGVVRREFVRHPGAVAVVALDEDDRVLLLRQYRVPVGAFLWEVPAGLLDVDGEPLLAAARRELAEEADLVAARWDVLADYCTTPGASTETLRVFLARELIAVPDGERHVREAEELGMATRWVALDDAVQAVLGGRVHNPSTVVGILAAASSRAAGWGSLRPVDAAWFRQDVAPA